MRRRSNKTMDNLRSRRLRVSEYLREKNIQFFPNNITRVAMLESLIGTLSVTDPAAALKAVLGREIWGSTEVAPGLGLPHARMAGIDRIVAAMGVCPKGFDDPLVGKTTTPQLFLLFFGPANRPQDHLAFLSSVTILFQMNGFLLRMVQLSTPETVLTEIRRLES
jgi:PTS system nitrogen regulatory IIA component